jgi:hypothetical protein
MKGAFLLEPWPHGFEERAFFTVTRPAVTPALPFISFLETWSSGPGHRLLAMPEIDGDQAISHQHSDFFLKNLFMRHRVTRGKTSGGAWLNRLSAFAEDHGLGRG